MTLVLCVLQYHTHLKRERETSRLFFCWFEQENSQSSCCVFFFFFSPDICSLSLWPSSGKYIFPWLRGASSSMCGVQKLCWKKYRVQGSCWGGGNNSVCQAHGNHQKLSAPFLTKDGHMWALKYFVWHLKSTEKKDMLLNGSKPLLSALLWKLLRPCS